jgi:hypothetical protein
MLRDNKNAHVKNIMRNNVPLLDAITQFSLSGKLKDMVFKQYKVANCLSYEIILK